MRACGDCTVCCTVMKVPGVSKEAYTACQHACKGCAIYATRPKECASYSCLWLLDEKGDLVREEERPDKSGLFFEMSSVHREKSAFEKETGIAFLMVREAQPGAFDAYYGQKVLKRLSRKALIIRVYQDGRRVAMGPPEKIREFGTYIASARSVTAP
jgi:hypothetical protein